MVSSLKKMTSDNAANSKKDASFTGVVLAGGYSRRMGSDKALIGASGKTLLKRQAQVLRDACASEVLISCRPEQPRSNMSPRRVLAITEQSHPGRAILRSNHPLAQRHASYRRRMENVRLQTVVPPRKPASSLAELRRDIRPRHRQVREERSSEPCLRRASQRRLGPSL